MKVTQKQIVDGTKKRRATRSEAQQQAGPAEDANQLDLFGAEAKGV